MGATHRPEMPADVAADPVQSAIWRDIVSEGSGYTAKDVPELKLLCYWHAIARSAQGAMADGDGGIEILDRVGNKPYRTGGEPAPLYRKHPALSVLKEASSEIRALSDQLGVSPGSRAGQPKAEAPSSPNGRLLSLVLSDREGKARKAAGE